MLRRFEGFFIYQNTLEKIEKSKESKKERKHVFHTVILWVLKLYFFQLALKIISELLNIKKTPEKKVSELKKSNR